jgi:hypothetical protein
MHQDFIIKKSIKTAEETCQDLVLFDPEDLSHLKRKLWK